MLFFFLSEHPFGWSLHWGPQLFIFTSSVFHLFYVFYDASVALVWARVSAQWGNLSGAPLRLRSGCDLIGNRIPLLSRYLSFVLPSDSRSRADAIHLGVKPSSRRSLSPFERERLSHRQNPPFSVLLSVFKWQNPPALEISSDCRRTAVTGLRLTELCEPEPTKTAHSHRKNIENCVTLRRQSRLCCSDERRAAVVEAREVVGDIKHLPTVPNLISGVARAPTERTG